MDLQTAVAASMLPASRGLVSAAFKEIQHEPARGAPFLELLWAAAGRTDVLPPSTVAELLGAAEEAVTEAERLGHAAIPLFDPRYPPLLSCTAAPPPVLWTNGILEPLHSRVVAVVGSRAASPYALQVAARLGAELAERGVVVASGLARGVDSAAHRGCLSRGGATVAVQGCGLDRVYPQEHAELAEEIRKCGLVVSELGPGAPPLPEHFPLRNRIISGISLAVVIVEASERSGSLITARCALEQGREVMAVPGSILTGRNRGSHALLKDGARVVESADDILTELGWSWNRSRDCPAAPPNSDPILDVMDPGEPYALDELVSACGIEGPRLLALLTELELRELIISSGGKYLRRG